MMRLPFAAGFPKLLSGVMRKQGPFYVQAQKLCTSHLRNHGAARVMKSLGGGVSTTAA